jgi:PAS domain-containing protein
LNACCVSARLEEPEVYVEFRVRRSNGDSDGVVWLACKGRNAPQANGKSRYVGAITDITEASERELKLLAYHESLFSLARNPLVVDRGDFARSSTQIMRQCAAALNVARAGLWRFSESGRQLVCLHQHDARVVNGEARAGQVLDAADFPTYFAAIAQRRALAVGDAVADPVLEEFRVTYLPQTGVRALLDVPVFHHGHLWGVVCFEDCEQTRVWDGDSQAYASSAVDLLSLAHEVSERIKSETELHATRERHRAFIQASLDSIWAVDVEPAIPTSLPPQEQIALLRERG